MERTLIAEGKAKLVWRHLATLGPESVWAATAVECAGEQDRFWAYHDRLFAAQAGVNRGAYSKDNLKRFGADLKLDAASFNACVDSDSMVGRVQAATEAGRQKGVRAVPTLFVGQQKIEGLASIEQLRQLVQAATR